MGIFKTDYFQGAYVEVPSYLAGLYRVSITSEGRSVYSADISSGMWCSSSIRYFLPYEISISDESGSEIFSESLSLLGKKVFIDILAESLSDSYSSCEAAREFSRKNGCSVSCRTPHSLSLEVEFPDIDFVDGSKGDFYASYSIGRFLKSDGVADPNFHRSDISGMSFKDIAFDILGIARSEEALDSVIFYSDANYEYQAESLIRSIVANGRGINKMYYYTIGFSSSLEYPGLTKVEIPIDEAKPTGYRTFEFYKPSVIFEHIKRYGGKALFLDTDVIVGRRFRIERFDHSESYPLNATGNWSHPFMYRGSETIDEGNLMEYFGIKRRTMEYVYSNVISFSERCSDFIFEWKSICDNQFLLSKKDYYFPFPDETAMNIVFWRRGIDRNLGRVYLNTTVYDPFEYVEENDGISGDPSSNNGIFGNSLLRCDNSSDIMLYHGIKDPSVLDQVISYIERSDFDSKIEQYILSVESSFK